MAPQARNWFGDDLRDAFGAEEVVECAGGLGDLADVGEPAERKTVGEPLIDRLAADAEQPRSIKPGPLFKKDGLLAASNI